jgi:hypothetical protein
MHPDHAVSSYSFRLYVRNDLLDEVDRSLLKLLRDPCKETHQDLVKTVKDNMHLFDDLDSEPIVSRVYCMAFGQFWLDQHYKTLNKYRKGKKCPILNKVCAELRAMKQ